MSQLVTSVKVAVDSRDLDSATSKSEELAENMNKGVEAAQGMISGFTAAYASVNAISSVSSAMADHWASASDRAYDFSSNMDQNLRVQYIWLQEQQNVLNAELAESADFWGEIGAKIEASATSAAKFVNNFMSFGETAAEQAERLSREAYNATEEVKELRDALNSGDISGAEFGEQYLAGLEEFRKSQEKVADDMQESFSYAYERQYVAADLTLDRVAKRQKVHELDIQELKRQADNAETPRLTKFYNTQAKALEDLFKLNEQYYADIEAEALESSQRQAAEDIKGLWLRNQEADVVLSDQIGKEKAAWKERYEQGLIEEDDYKIALEHIEETHQNKLQAIRDQANEQSIRTAKKAATEMSSATSSLLSILDDDLASLFDSINSLISALQTLQMIDGVGGFFGLAGGLGGIGGGVSSFGGISVGTVSVNVQGNTDTVGMKNSAQEGVYGALNGIVKDTMAKESKYGGLFNPSSGVHKM